MFMISKFMFDVMYKDQRLLSIDPYEQLNHINNFYYFRLGAIKDGDSAIPIENELVIQPYGFQRVWSMESFTLSERVVGLFGNTSMLVDKGLQLIHSPSIDPGFDGSLALGIRNNIQEPIILKREEKIGKVLFFDCADTFISIDKFVKNVLKEQDLQARREAGEAILRAYSQMTKDQNTVD